MPKQINLTDVRFGRLVARQRISGGVQGTLWECQCDCGSQKTVRQSSLRKGHTKSCGCLRSQISAKRMATHGKSKLAEYNIWTCIKGRCLNTKNPAFAKYGGRGITICDRWGQSFAAFLDDMGRRPSEKHSIERLNNDLGYEPGNCVWALRKQQARNKRTNRQLTHGGQTLCLADWVERTGLSKGCIQRRLDNGWSVEKALTTPRLR